MEQWIMQHVGAALGATAAFAAAAGWLSRHLGLFVEKAVNIEVVKALGVIKSPKLRAICSKLDRLIESEIPAAGDAKYAMLTALIMSELPATAAPIKPVIQAILEGLGAGAKAGLADAVVPVGIQPSPTGQP